MTLLYQSPIFQEHDTGQHPECSARVKRIAAGLKQAGLDARCRQPTWADVDRETLGLVHDLSYVDSVRQFAENGGGHLEPDTVVSRKSYQVALSAAGAVCDAVKRVVAGPQRRALCLVRPPGHHARKNRAMGFCLLGNIAIAARMAAKKLDLDRVLVVDWDVHHGNGTQDAFWADPQLALLSIHRWPFYPGSGGADEIGAGKGLGTIRNLPVRFGTSRKDYLARFTKELEAFADRMRPQLVLVSAGFDTHRQDPIGSLGLETEDFVPLTNLVLDVADQHAEGRLVSVLEGGYNLDVLPDCVAVHLGALLKRNATPPDLKKQP